MNSPTADSALERLYTAHHKKNRSQGFVLLKDERAAFIRNTIGEGKKVADIGCRDGALTSEYMQGNEVLGVDIDSTALALAAEKGIATHHMNLNDLWDLPPATFDAVVAAEVVEHLYYPELVFKKIAHLLTAQGVLVGTVPNPFSYINRLRYLAGTKAGTPLSDPTHINHFTVAELKSLLVKHFEEVEIHGMGRLGWLAQTFPQQFAFDLGFVARNPKKV